MSAPFVEINVSPMQLFCLKQAIEIDLRTGGRMQLSRVGSAGTLIKNILEPITGKVYKRSRNGKVDALRDVEAILAAIETDQTVEL